MTEKKKNFGEELRDFFLVGSTKIESLSEAFSSLLRKFLKKVAVDHDLDPDIAWILLFGLSVFENHDMELKIEKINKE